MDRERRGLSEPVTLRSEGDGTVSGYAALYNTETVIAGFFREKIAPGAFDTALGGTDDVRALFNHDPNYVLGRTKSGTLTLTEDTKGLRYDVRLPDTQAAQDVRTLIQRGDVSGSSFGFFVEADEWDESETKRGKLPLRIIRKVELFDVSPVTYPAYPQTSVTARSIEDAVRAATVVAAERQARLTLARLRNRLAIERARAWVR